MDVGEFEQMLVEAELQPHQCSKAYGVAFSVSLQAPTLFGTRYQCDWIVYQPAEFVQLTPARAQSQIAALKKKLERAAKTQQGVVR